MSRYIDAEVFADRMLKTWDTADEQKRIEIVSVIANLVTPILVGTPTADVVKVRHGRWILKKDGRAHCSECDAVGMAYVWSYCSNCGAKMDGDKL